MWENQEDRTRVMARFRSFDMTGMTNYNSGNYRSPSQISINDDSGSQQEAGAVNGKRQILNIMTKLPTIANSPTIPGTSSSPISTND